MKDYIPLPLPFIPGWDVSGVVEAVGAGVTKFKKGDEVYGPPDVAHKGGAYAEYVVVKEVEAAHKPKSIDHIHAATVPVVVCVRTHLSPLRGLVVSHLDPRLAPWAAFLRRFAAKNGSCYSTTGL